MALEVSTIEDINAVLVKDCDIVRFTYNAVQVDAPVYYNNGMFGANAPDNNPMSCPLSELGSLVGDFLIIGTVG